MHNFNYIPIAVLIQKFHYEMKMIDGFKNFGPSILLIGIFGISQLFRSQEILVTWAYAAVVLITLFQRRRSQIISAAALSLAFIAVILLENAHNPGFRIVLLWNSIAQVILLPAAFYLVGIFHIRLKASRDKSLMSGIFSYGTQGIILTRNNGSILLVNPFSEMLFDYNREELIGQSIKILIPKIEITREESQVSLIDSQSPQHELTATKKNGQCFPIDASINEFKSGNNTYFVIFYSDISIRKQNETILSIKTSEVEAANKELEAFSYSVSHDLRSPLRAIGGFAQMLEEDFSGSLNIEGRRLLGNIQQSAERMGLLIDDLLTFSRLGKKEIKRSRIDMTELTSSVLNDINHTTKHHAEVSIAQLHAVYADPSVIRNVMMNLISNALKYSSKTAMAKVEIESRVEGDAITYVVRDNGAGFDMKYVDKLFGVFQRLHTQYEFEGTGVGLAIAKRIIQKHGGRMWAEGKEGHGASFYFSLPANRSSPSLVNDVFSTVIN